jgi:hypothetical protein
MTHGIQSFNGISFVAYDHKQNHRARGELGQQNISMGVSSIETSSETHIRLPVSDVAWPLARTNMLFRRLAALGSETKLEVEMQWNYKEIS